MENLPEFVANHPILCFGFVSILGMLGWTFVQGGLRGLARLSPQEATRLINSDNAMVIDVRGDSEYGTGHIVNAVHVPHNQLDKLLGKLDKYKDRPIIATCRSGSVSAGVGNSLRKHGFTKVYHLSGGLAAWEGANLPLSRA